MYKMFIALMALSLLCGCAVKQEAYYVDQEWGKAQMASWDKMIANPAGKYDGDNPTGMEGINSEEVMDVYNRSFAEKSEAMPIFELGVTSGNGGN